MFKQFDLHFSGARRKFGGLVNWREATQPFSLADAHSSAVLLARSMYSSKDIEGISWIGVQGGSAVLTQAMAILASRGVKLLNHSVYLYEPKTDVSETLKFANKLEARLDLNFYKAGFLNYIGNRTALKVIFNRLRNKYDDYNLSNAAVDSAKLISNVKGAAASALAAASYTGLAIASPTAIPVMATIAGALGVGISAIKIGDKIAEHVAPYSYNKHVAKLK